MKRYTKAFLLFALLLGCGPSKQDLSSQSMEQLLDMTVKGEKEQSVLATAELEKRISKKTDQELQDEVAKVTQEIKQFIARNRTEKPDSEQSQNNRQELDKLDGMLRLFTLELAKRNLIP